MDDQLHFPDYTYRLSQEWNVRDKKFDLLKISQATIKMEEESNSTISNVHEPAQNNQTLLSEGTEDISPIIQTLESEKGIESKIVIKEEKEFKDELVQKATYLQHVTLEDTSVLSKKLPTTGFHVWLNSMAMKPSENTSPTGLKDNVLKRDKIERSKSERKEGSELAPVSETLAKLLVSQGYKEEAIMMYEKLSLKFPEKKDTFARLIVKLKI